MEKIKWGVLGTAKIAVTQGIPAIMRSDNSELCAIASRSSEKLKQFEGLCPNLYDSYDKLLENPEIQAVYIPLPNHLHCEWVIKALSAGKHVLCEKPLAMTYDECVRMADCAEKNGKILMEAFMYRHTGKSKLVADIVKSGRLGEIRYVRSEFGFEINDPYNIRLRKKTGGGALFDMGCYPINFCNWIARLTGTKIESADAYFVTRKDIDGDYVDVRCNARINYENGMTAVAASWFDSTPFQYAEIVGRKAMLKVPCTYTDDPVPLTLKWYDYENDPMCRDAEIMFLDREYFVEKEFPVETGDRYCREVCELSSAILENRETVFPVKESLINMKLIEDLYRTMEPNEKSVATPRLIIPHG